MESSELILSDGDSLELSTSATFGDSYNSINDPSGTFSGFNYLNFDIHSIERSISGGDIDSVTVSVTDGNTIANLGTLNDFDGVINLDVTNNIFSMDVSSPVEIVFTFDVSGTPVISDGTVLPVAVDFFSIGYLNDGLVSSEKINNQIIRIEAEETGDNTGEFEGSLVFTMLNQLNSKKSTVFFLDDPKEFSSPISDGVEFPVNNFHFGDSEITVNYLENDIAGNPFLLDDSADIFTHSGTPDFDSDVYDPGEIVLVTVTDADLNSNPEFFDVYTVADHTVVFDQYPYSADPARDTVGKVGLGNYDAAIFGAVWTLLEITFDDKRWGSGINGGTCNQSGSPDDGFAATGFALIETDVDTGVFQGDFIVPDTFCDSNDEIISTLDTEMSVKYSDFVEYYGGLAITQNFADIGTAPLFCNDMTVDELISSGLDNVIDNRDGHLDGAIISGTNNDDLILASDTGNDIRAKKGNDCVIGGSGNDQLRGGNGNDVMFGLVGNDLLIGGKLNDLLHGGNGNDVLKGSANDDQLFGEDGDDNLKGNAGDDALSCGPGTDIANGGRDTDSATSDCETVKGIP